MSDLTTWMPAIVATVTVAGAGIVYIWQKRTDRKNELLRQRRKAYTDLLVALNRQLTHQCLPNLARLNEARAEVFLVASDEVAKSTGNFFKEVKKGSEEEQLQGSENNPERKLRQYAEMVLAMRYDCFEKSKLNINQTIDCMPISHSNEDEKTIVE